MTCKRGAGLERPLGMGAVQLWAHIAKALAVPREPHVQAVWGSTKAKNTRNSSHSGREDDGRWILTSLMASMRGSARIWGLYYVNVGFASRRVVYTVAALYCSAYSSVWLIGWELGGRM